MPNLKQCCLDNGLKSEKCLSLCDSTKFELDNGSSDEHIIQCTQYVNITFKCLSLTLKLAPKQIMAKTNGSSDNNSYVITTSLSNSNSPNNISDCCMERGVSQFCSTFCHQTKPNDNLSTDFHHQLVCVHYMPTYSSCLMERFNVVPSEPRSLLAVSVHQDWALIQWEPSEILPETITKYNDKI